MRTVLYSLSFLGQQKQQGRFERQKKWLDYYLKLLPYLRCNKIIMTDNNSDINALKELDVMLFDEDKNLLFEGTNKKVEIYRFNKYQDKENKVFLNPTTDCPYWWRGIFAINKFKNDYDKVIFLDTDAFIFTNRIIDYINYNKTGWLAFWCPKHDFSETIMQILNIDTYFLFDYYTSKDYLNYNGTLAEVCIPFTHVEKKFNGDRWCEYPNWDKKQLPFMDYWTQCENHIKVEHELFKEKK